MNHSYGARRAASEAVGRFSTQVLGPGVGNGVDGFAVRHGYHCLLADMHLAADRFAAEAPLLMDRMLLALDELAGELATAVTQNDGPYIAAVGELSWLIAQSEYCYAACQLSARRKQYVLAQPVLSCFRNLDTRPLNLRALRLEGSFESLRSIDLGAAKRLTIAPGDSFLVNGFETLIWFEESGIALGSVSTLPLGAYEATFDSETGRRVGLFSTEMRLSSLEVVLRTLAAAGWEGAMDMASEAAGHPVRELRWAALNYFWRCDAPDLAGRLDDFAKDADPQIAAMARHCLAQLRAEQAA